MLNLRSIRIEQYTCAPRFEGCVMTCVGAVCAVLYLSLGMFEATHTLKGRLVDVFIIGSLLIAGLWNMLLNRKVLKREVRLGTWRDRMFCFSPWLFLLVEVVQTVLIVGLICMVCSVIDGKKILTYVSSLQVCRQVIYMLMVFGILAVREYMSLYQYYFRALSVSPRVYRPRRWTLRNIFKYRFW